MPVLPGARLGPYEVLGLIGAGGMGEVYKARDTRLDRTVAIKVLPAHVSADPERRARFEREAKTISQLNHPHICTLHDVGTHEGATFLVMEHLAGETLAERLKKGPLPLGQALNVAAQIADALAAAHRQDIIHRDLKPGNVILTKSGIKLLDFGLAKLKGLGEQPAAGMLVSAPTQSGPLTGQGTILGTLQYMAPEQLEGKPADARTDLWALGAILYEMVTGARAFGGTSAASLIGAILERDPAPVSSLEPLTPPAVDRLVRRCLAKDPDDRWYAAHDLADELKWLGGEQLPPSTAVMARRSTALAWRERVGWVGALTLAALLTWWVVSRIAPAVAPSSPLQLSVVLGPGVDLVGVPLISPSGETMAFVGRESTGRSRLWLRDLDGDEIRAIEGTEGATDAFWSPDGHQLGYFARGKLWKVVLGGTPPVALCDVPNSRGGTWNRDGLIVYSPGVADSLLKIPASGGRPSPVTTLWASRAETSHRWPHFLPDGRHFLYLVRSGRPEEGGLYVGSLDGDSGTRIADAHSNAVYATSGHLLYAREKTLLAQPFDPRLLRTTGDPLPLASGVGYSVLTSLAMFSSAARAEMIAFTRSGSSATQLVEVDRAGAALRRVGTAREYLHFAWSPDGTSVAYEEAGPQTNDLWLLQTATGESSRLTFDPGNDTAPVWSHDGRFFVFTSSRTNPPSIFKRGLTGSDADTPVAAGPGFPTDLSPDGTLVIFQRQMPETKWDLFMAPLDGRSPPRPLVQTQGDDTQGQLSPDDRWLAYVSNESGQPEVYVQPFPPTGAKWQVSSGRGILPEWTSEGRELAYLVPTEGKLMSVRIDGSERFQASAPRPLFEVPVGLTHGMEAGSHYAASRDGSRFLVNLPPEQQGRPSVIILSGWTRRPHR